MTDTGPTGPSTGPAGPAAPTVLLSRSPALAPLLARGALRSPFKRPRPRAPFPHARLTLPSVRADPARLAAYERVCGFATGADALPATYPHVLGFPLAMRLMSGADFPLPLLGLVHTSIDITRHTALPATGTYELTVHVAGLAPHRRGTEAVVVTGLREHGEVVWESTSTYLARHRTEGTAAEAPEERHGPLPEADRWRLPGNLGRRYGAASGDRNPIHLHPVSARLFGFPRAIAHGMWTVARCLAAHGTPEAALVRTRFRAPVLLPGEVAYAADGVGRFEVRSPDGRRTHLTGEVLPLPA
ncbi:MaoC/PaaZ C-terminal domain-containing protein [Streptomyces sp. NPDC018610]|uniref:MaoC/PaaZ C-terminal domain-containing protein n=1 Tax=Streptomyces sp. NPDC018610 TaxID=3365049 RepID=UPI0037A37EC1